MKRIFIFTFLLLLAVRVVSAATVDTLAVHSPSMDRDIPVVAIVPEGVSAAEPCPVVYLLHGYSGDETAWLKIKPSLPAIADRERIAFICPGVGNSWYLDSKVREKSLYETFMTRELLPAVEARYPVARDRSGRAITGLSMGGFGAMSLAIKHKGLFGAAGSTSGGLDIRPFPQNWEIPQLLGRGYAHQPHPAAREWRPGDRLRLRLRRFLLRGKQRFPRRVAAPGHHARFLCPPRRAYRCLLGQCHRLSDRILPQFLCEG